MERGGGKKMGELERIGRAGKDWEGRRLDV